MKRFALWNACPVECGAYSSGVGGNHRTGVRDKVCIIVPGRINIKSKTGELIGWMKKDLLLPNRINVYDKYGNMRDFWVRDILNPDTWFFKKGR